MPSENDTGNYSVEAEVLHTRIIAKPPPFMSLANCPFATFIESFLSGLWVIWNLSQLLKFGGPTKILYPLLW